MINTMVKNNHSVIYINSSTQSECAEGWFKKIKVISFGVAFRKNEIFKCVRVLKNISTIIEREKPDIVHVHDPYFIPCLKKAKEVGAKTVYDKHEAYEVIGGISGKSSKFLEKAYLKYIDGVVYVAEKQESYINDCGYKNKAFVPNYQSKMAYDSSKVEKCSGIRLFYAGDLSDVSRNISIMLRLVDDILKEFDDSSCVIAGKTNDKNIMQLLVDLGRYGDRFKYVPYMLYEDVIKNTKMADIGLYLTKFDPNNVGSSPNKINEYLLAGIAIFSQGRYADWEMIDGQCGMVYNYDAGYDEMYAGLMEMISNPTMLASMKSNSKRLGEQRTWEMVESNYQDLYDRIMGL